MPRASAKPPRTEVKVRGVKGAKAGRAAVKSPVVRSRRRRGGFKSDAFEAIHATASDLHQVGAIDKQTMRSYDELCIAPPKEISPNKIRELRMRLNMSQPVFAMRIGASPSTVEKWESGVNKPTGIALRFLHVVDRLGTKALE